MAQASVKGSINASAEQVWQHVGDFGKIDRFSPAITNSVVQGSGIGARRVLTLFDGSQLVEQLEALDDQTRTLRYSLVSGPLPVANYSSTMAVRELGQAQSEFEWSATFDAQGAPEGEVVQLIEQFYASALEELRKLHNNN